MVPALAQTQELQHDPLAPPSGDFTDPSARDADLIACLEALMAGDFSRRPKGDDALSRTVRELIARRVASAYGTLDSLVAQTTTANETAVAVAHVHAAARAVDERARGISAEVDRLVGSVRAIRDSSDGATERARLMADAAAQGHRDADTAAAQMARIEELVERAGQQISALEEAAQDVGSIVTAISKIAGQTNLLALNATIEAARAGEAGKGFAVVASEVKNLSNQTAKATEEIAARIARFHEIMEAIVAAMAESGTSVADGSRIIGSLASAMRGIGEEAASVDNAMREIAASVAAQSEAAGAIGGSIGEIARMAGHTLEEVEATSSAIDATLAVTQDSLKMVASYDLSGAALSLAKADHAIFKKRLINMAAGREKPMRGQFCSDGECQLGRWLAAPDAAAFRRHPAFSRLETAHKAFHAHAREAVCKLEGGNKAGAEADIAKVEEILTTLMSQLDSLIAERGRAAPA
ncbi:MAG: methyl-accepting chemotaxis protein [Pseudomonadota bacterium]